MHLFRFLCITVLLLILTACSEGQREDKEPLSVSVLFNNTASDPFSENWRILEEYKSRQNVILDVRLGDNENYERAIALAFESGDPPDIILKVWPDTIRDYGNMGKLLSLTDYRDLMAEFNKYVEEKGLEPEIEKLASSNGEVYIFPGFKRPIQVQQWIYRKDLFDGMGYHDIDTYEDLFQALVRLKEEHPNSTPLTATWEGAHLFAMMGAGYGIPAGWNGMQYYNASLDKWQFAPVTDNYREMVSFLHRCYEAEILDPAVFTQSESEYYDKLIKGSAFVTVSWITSGFDNWNKQLEDNGVANGQWAPLPVPESTIGIRALPGVDPFRKGLALSSRVASTSNVERLISFIDWAVYSEEGRVLSSWGVEGLTFEKTEKGRMFLPSIYTASNPNGAKRMGRDYGFGQLFNLNEDEELEDFKKPTEIVTFLKKSLERQETLPLPPSLQMDSQSIDAIGAINEKLVPYVSASLRSFVTGGLDMEKDWLSYVNEAENMGYGTLEILWNDAWENMK